MRCCKPGLCFVVLNPRVFLASRVDFGLFFLIHKFSTFIPPPPHFTPPACVPAARTILPTMVPATVPGVVIFFLVFSGYLKFVFEVLFIGV